MFKIYDEHHGSGMSKVYDSRIRPMEGLFKVYDSRNRQMRGVFKYINMYICISI